MKINTLEDFNDLAGVYSDLHKDVYGVRPRGVFNNITYSELVKKFDSLVKVFEVEKEAIAERDAFKAKWADSEARWTEFTAA